AFSEADHAGCIDSRKSTYGGIQFLGDKLVSWMSKKQNCTAMSLAEAEYVALSASCAQVMWMRTQLQDYGFNYNKISLYRDSQSAIAISCNPVQHSHTKHIHTRYHFIKEQVENGIIELYFVRTEYQLADMFSKALPEDRFKYLVRRIGMRCLTPAELENRRDLPKDTPQLEIAVFRYDGDECDEGIMQTKIELTLEQSQQGVSNDVLNEDGNPSRAIIKQDLEVTPEAVAKAAINAAAKAATKIAGYYEGCNRGYRLPQRLQTAAKAATEAATKVPTKFASCCEGCNKCCSEGCHRSSKLLRRLQQRLQAVAKAAIEGAVKAAIEVVASNLDRGGSKSWRKRLRIIEEGVLNSTEDEGVCFILLEGTAHPLYKLIQKSGAKNKLAGRSWRLVEILHNKNSLAKNVGSKSCTQNQATIDCEYTKTFDD
nr:retrovirus-related Pol polyprotein from transposon TNT 1-94 [Tanacetum cinerariifolium]